MYLSNTGVTLLYPPVLKTQFLSKASSRPSVHRGSSLHFLASTSGCSSEQSYNFASTKNPFSI